MAHTVKNPLAMQETWVQSLVQEDPLDKGMATQSSSLPGELHGLRSMAGYSPWDGKQVDMTEQLTLFIHANVSQLFLEKHDFILQIF